MTARGLLARPSRVVAGGFVRARTHGWPRHSRIFAVGERTGWSVDEDARHVEAAARRLRYQVAPSSWASFAAAQSLFLTSHFEALQPRWLDSTHRLGTAYLHGRPGTEGYPEFNRAFEALRSAPERFSRIQVTHGEMRDLVLEAGVDRRAVHLIPIGIDLENFPLATPERRSAARARFGVPRDAFVVGSFQKDGVGWGEGLEPGIDRDLLRVRGPDPDRPPRSDRRTARRPAGGAAEQRRADPAQLLVLEHRHAPARPRPLPGELGLERAAPDHEPPGARGQRQLIGAEHVVAGAGVFAVDPRVPQRRDAVEVNHRRRRLGGQRRPPPPVLGVEPAIVVPAPRAGRAQRARRRARNRCRQPRQAVDARRIGERARGRGGDLPAREPQWHAVSSSIAERIDAMLSNTLRLSR